MCQHALPTTPQKRNLIYIYQYFVVVLQKIRPVSENVSMCEKHTESLLNNIRNVAKEKGIDLGTPGQFSKVGYCTLMCILVSDFSKIFELVKSKVHSSKKRLSRTRLTVLLVKLRIGLSNGVLFIV